jgi:hypothetical protein
MSDLVAFLRARLDEDEQAARDGDDACWHIDYCDDEGKRYHERFDPARVLREVEAKRRILDEHGSGSDSCDAHDASMRSIPCDTLLLLALPYADHPDYREEWRP